jgi:hypothetical protein
MAFFALSLILVTIPTISAAAAAITLSPNPQAPGASVTVEGADFNGTSAVGIGFGAEVTVTNEVVNRTGSGTGPYIGYLSFRPIKPGTLNYTVNVANGLITYVVNDNGDGTLSSTSQYFGPGSTVNYTSGQYTSYSTSDPGIYTVATYANYTRYEYDVTPAAGVTTLASGAFAASITVPSVANGNYTVTAIDTAGNVATATLNTIPEGLTLGVMLLVLSVAAVVSTRYFRKQPKLKEYQI